ncbi:lysophospholipid acyltransferase family protein [Pantanalinema sp. GBBB05]|uniref:lysophospholipid acyltransferase family protein n=1 Tax=Pantanalinema sp. GBBB05 TaxID=2604139 RepID=UPI001DD1A4DD|nr:1-acyl-sn-glycerol-3-phosphate acyltransferase [Pantanalinema sp. GBBB05]
MHLLDLMTPPKSSTVDYSADIQVYPSRPDDRYAPSPLAAVDPFSAPHSVSKSDCPHGLPPLSRVSPWLISLAYPVGRHALLPFYFQQIEVSGQEHLPHSGAVILAPTHRSRWDAFMIPYVAGHDITGRHLRFMVSANEMTGLQGWFIRRMGGFPIDPKRPTIASLRHGVELLQAGETLVIFPEGDIYRDKQVQPLKPGLARLALQAEASRAHLGITIVPISICYSEPLVPWRCRVAIRIGKPLKVADYNTAAPKQQAKKLTDDLQQALSTISDDVDDRSEAK